MCPYYVYAYLRTRDLSPYYIGKGKHKRAWDIDHSVVVPKDESRIVFLERHLSEVGALALERRMIRWYGRKDLGTGILRNMTDGGDGCSGRVYKHSEESKAKISAAQLGQKRKPHSDETKAKLKAKRAHRLPDSPETRKRKSESMIGKGKWNAGKKMPQMSHPGIPQSEETRAKRSAALIGRAKSPETIQKMRLAQQARALSKRSNRELVALLQD